jgi:glucokinase
MKRELAKTLTIGVDLGGTKVEIALIDGDGSYLFSKRFLTHPERGPEGILTDIKVAVKSSNNETGLEAQALGIGAAGQVDSEGVIRAAPNLPFKNEPIQKRLEAELGIPVVVTNDVRAATYGEWKYGSGKEENNLVVVFVGTGIGGGVICDGRLLGGCTNTFGELGHITLVADGRTCRCPNNGCIEAYAGGWAIAERAQEAVAKDPIGGEMLVSLAGGVKKITAETVSTAYSGGDQMARRIVEETGEYLGAGIVGIVNAFNPCLLVLGGGVIEGIPDLIAMVEAIVREKALKPNLDRLSVVKARLGGKAGVVGAAALARGKVIENYEPESS